MGANFKCFVPTAAITPNTLKIVDERKIGSHLMAIVCEGKEGKSYLSPNKEHEIAARVDEPEDIDDIKLPDDKRNFWTPDYGLDTFGAIYEQMN